MDGREKLQVVDVDVRRCEFSGRAGQRAPWGAAGGIYGESSDVSGIISSYSTFILDVAVRIFNLISTSVCVACCGFCFPSL